MQKIIKSLMLVIFLGWQLSALAAFDMELTKGIDKAIPLAVVPFAWESSNAMPPVNVSDVIAQDLQNSGRFDVIDKSLLSQQPHQTNDIDYQYWLDKQVDDILVGRVQPLSNGQYKVEFSLVNLFKAKYQAGVPAPVSGGMNDSVLVSQEFIVDAKSLRRLAHHISDVIYQQLTGERGIFSTRLAYVLVQRQIGQPPTYFLEISDMDGHNAQPILRSSEPIMSPSWSPDGKKIAYVSFEGKRPKIYVSEVATGKRELISSFPGINGAPAWSPDGNTLAVALSKHSNPNIYLIDLKTKKDRQLTFDSAINTEPNWSPDGRSIIFTSDRGGSPQIYRVNNRTRKVQRLTFDGNYNTTASFTPDGMHVIMLHRGKARLFNVAILDLQTGQLAELTTPGLNESPSVAPNGKMVVYATNYGGQGVLGMVSTDGRVKLRLPDQDGAVQEPVWSPYL